MEIILPEELKSERLVIRPISLDDKKVWLKFIKSEEALKYISFIESSEEACDEWISRQLNRYRNNEGGLYGLYLNDILIGQCGLLLQNIDGVEELEIGYHVLPEYWGKAYAFEAARTWKDYAFKNRISSSVISMIHLENKASRRVAEKNGMTVDKETVYKNLPVVIYRITYSEWLQEQQPEIIA